MKDTREIDHVALRGSEVGQSVSIGRVPGEDEGIGTGTPRTWIDLATALFTALDRTPEIEFIDMPDHIRNQYQYHTSANISRLRATGWNTPATTLEEAVGDYVGNYLVPGKHLGE